MESIIQQITLELVKNILEKFKNTNLDLNELGPQMLEECKTTSRRLVEAYVQELNQRMRADKEGRKGKLTLKEKDKPRTILTEIGTIRINRDCYYDKTREKYTTPLDQVLGIGKYERVMASIGARLVEAATEHSYAKSAQIVTDGAVSRQTVRNQILKIKVPEKEPAIQNKVMKELHIFADEDHVHMQRPHKEKGKKGKIVPLVVVTEGINTESKRHSTQNPMSFVDEGFDTKNLWQTVSGYIGKAYDVNSLEKIYVHADGGTWIKNGLEEYRQTIHVIDGFHFERELKRIAGNFQGRNIRQRMHSAIEKEDKKKAGKILKEMMERAEDEKTKERVKAFGKYLFNHWKEIVRRRKENVPGSCTEGQVSHLLSERFSRNPMAWSEKGLGKLSTARIHMKNGGRLSYKDFGKGEKKERYSDYAEQMMSGMLKETADWSIFTRSEPMIFDTTSGTQQALHQIGLCRNMLN